MFPTLLAQPPLLLHANEFEPIARNELREAWEDLTAEDHYNPLRDDQAAALEALFARTEDIASGQVGNDEAQALAKQMIGFARLDESFAYVREGV